MLRFFIYTNLFIIKYDDNMAKVRLTENELKQIVKESVLNILNEGFFGFGAKKVVDHELIRDLEERLHKVQEEFQNMMKDPNVDVFKLHQMDIIYHRLCTEYANARGEKLYKVMLMFPVKWPDKIDGEHMGY